MNILILTGKFGMGHLSAANALREQLGQDGHHADVVDLFEYAAPELAPAMYWWFNVLVTYGGVFYNIYHDLTVNDSGEGRGDNLLGGLDRPTGGSVIVDGRELSTLKDEELTIFRRRKIGFVFQNYNLVPVLNVYENIVLPIQLDGRAPDKDYTDRIIETLGLDPKLQNLPNNLSGGQQQRVAIARALAAKPAIILADEPTGNLDSRTSQDVMSLLKVTSQRFAQTIVMITHNEAIAQMADRVIRIEDGRIVVRG